MVRQHVTDPLLEDMLFCPVMYYGSASERDMEFGQFVIMFKALYLEGFARPLDGVRVIVRVLLEKYRAAGGERRMKCGVARILEHNGRAAGIVLDDGEEISADHVISSIGAPETESLFCRALNFQETFNPPPSGIGQLSVETITVLDRQPVALGVGRRHHRLFQRLRRVFTYAASDAAGGSSAAG